MTTSKLVFDPFCRYDDPCETYRRMRDEAPGYCREQHDFCTPSRHEGVGRAVHRSEGMSL